MTDARAYGPLSAQQRGERKGSQGEATLLAELWTCEVEGCCQPAEARSCQLAEKPGTWDAEGLDIGQLQACSCSALVSKCAEKLDCRQAALAGYGSVLRTGLAV